MAKPKSITRSIPATFVRGGTSNGLIINRSHLPSEKEAWRPILSSAMGSPDPFGRQLNGMGQGISSTSKICVVGRSERGDADVEYVFVQVGIKGGEVDVAGNCGNMSSAVGPLAWDEGLIDEATDRNEEGEVTVRLFNWNTNKIIHSTFLIGKDDKFDPIGDYALDGVSGEGSKITLSFIDPAGAKTGTALPSGKPVDTLKLQDGRSIEASLIDVANPGVFIRALDVGIAGDTSPDMLGADTKTMDLLEEIRQEGARLMGLDPNIQSIPKVVLLSKPTDSAASAGTNIVCRALSMQQAHKAVPLTLALNLGAACGMKDTIPAMTAVGAEGKDSVIIAHASGKLEVGSEVVDGKIKSAQLHRTARVLMKGDVFYTTNEDS